MPHLSDSPLSQLDRFLLSLRQRYESVERDVGALHGAIGEILSSWPDDAMIHATRPQIEPSELPACAFLGDALALGRQGAEADLAQSVAALTGTLTWTYSYPTDPRWPELGQKVAFSQIVGARGILASSRLYLGLTLIAPHTHYPAHRHPAIETYLVIAGNAWWQLDDAPESRHAPGSLILHPRNAAHAMRTEAEPLLALFSWHGEIGSPSVYLTDS